MRIASLTKTLSFAQLLRSLPCLNVTPYNKDIHIQHINMQSNAHFRILTCTGIQCSAQPCMLKLGVATLPVNIFPWYLIQSNQIQLDIINLGRPWLQAPHTHRGSHPHPTKLSKGEDTHMLCISTSERVLRTPFAGRNRLSDAKTTYLNLKVP